MKTKWIDNGATFLEIIIALAILAVIAVPVMSTFVFSERGTIETGQILDATFTAQRRLEQLQALDFRAAVDAGNRSRERFEDAFVEVEAAPYHSNISHFPHVFTLVVQDVPGRNLFVSTPTGGEVRSINALTVPVNVRLSITATGYTVTLQNVPTPERVLTAGDALIIFNASRYTGTHNINLTVTLTGGRRAEVHVYDTFTNTARIIVSGAAQVRRFRGFTNRNFSMLRARVSVFESQTATTPQAVVESILELLN